MKTKDGKEVLASIKAMRVPTGVEVTVYAPKLAAALQAFHEAKGLAWRNSSVYGDYLQVDEAPLILRYGLSLENVLAGLTTKLAVRDPVVGIIQQMATRREIEQAVGEAKVWLKDALTRYVGHVHIEAVLTAADTVSPEVANA